MSMTNRIVLHGRNIDPKILANSKALVAAFFQQKEIAVEEAASDFSGSEDTHILVEAEGKPDLGQISAVWMAGSGRETCEISSQEINCLKELPRIGRENITQIAVKQVICKLLTKITGQTLPWGIISGIRPGKLVTAMNNLSILETGQGIILGQKYLISPEKIKLLQQVSAIQEPYRQKAKKQQQLVSLYISVPFCPSRCSYCSFSFEHGSGRENKLSKYLQVLKQEIELVGNQMKASSALADNIYIGGGTPTVLTAAQLDNLLAWLETHIPVTRDREYTIEAGRPDTIDREKLLCLKKYRVNRLSINPQTMNDTTLTGIGRRHTVQNIIDAYSLARQLGDWIINMDIILGLPGEGRTEVEQTIRSVLELKPDNITIHALALKKRSQVWENRMLIDTGSSWQQIQRAVFRQILNNGYQPYYLYRQKNSAGNLENVGFTVPGKECRYNIAVIEENETIFGLGAGACSKIRDSNALTHQNIYQPSDISVYLDKFKSVDEKRNKAYLLQK